MGKMHDRLRAESWAERVAELFIKEYPLEEDTPTDEKYHAEQVLMKEIRQYLSVPGVELSDAMAGTVCVSALTRAHGEWHELKEDPLRFEKIFGNLGPEEIVKVQVSLFASDGKKRVLVYDKDQNFVVDGLATEEILRQMGGEPKRFFRARYDSESENWLILDRAQWQEW